MTERIFLSYSPTADSTGSFALGTHIAINYADSNGNTRVLEAEPENQAGLSGLVQEEVFSSGYINTDSPFGRIMYAAPRC